MGFYIELGKCTSHSLSMSGIHTPRLLTCFFCIALYTIRPSGKHSVLLSNMISSSCISLFEGRFSVCKRMNILDYYQYVMDIY